MCSKLATFYNQTLERSSFRLDINLWKQTDTPAFDLKIRIIMNKRAFFRNFSPALTFLQTKWVKNETKPICGQWDNRALLEKDIWIIDPTWQDSRLVTAYRHRRNPKKKKVSYEIPPHLRLILLASLSAILSVIILDGQKTAGCSYYRPGRGEV